jgi:transposase
MADCLPLAAVIGLDWADQHHDLSLRAAGGAAVERMRVAHTPEALGAWLAALRARFGGAAVGVALETSRGPLVHALLDHPWVVVYPVNPRSLKRFREAFAPSGAKDDPTDADLLRELLERHRDRLRPWTPDAPATRALRRLVEDRRGLVDLRTRCVLQLTANLKGYFPQALAWTGDDLASALATDFLTRWPTLAAVQRVPEAELAAFLRAHHCRRPAVVAARTAAVRAATPLTADPAALEAGALLTETLARQLAALREAVARYDAAIAAHFATHADAAVFRSLPGAGATLAPRLLVACGTDRARFADAGALQQYGGLAPVTVQSGRTRVVRWRWAAPAFVRQSFHEFAAQSVRFSPWARAYYAAQRARGKGHHAAVRALAYKWIRIIWRCWQTRTPYDEAHYTRALQQRGSPHAPRPEEADAPAVA